MSQPPSANMAIVMPTDLGDINVWGPILDQALGVVVDRHDHTTGKGVKIPSAALNINADVSWSAGGVSRAITDLKAVDFAPSAVQTALAGALFVSDGTSGLTTNELYWRTTSGVNVKLTAGSALNVAAFTGGIGGDYSAVGALVLFDDATDSYWFQQQVGASVRQYARMRSADVDLYEYKANPAAGVPTNRVRLASPTGLAASYALTMPPALGGTARATLQVTSSGVASFSSTKLMLNGAAAFPLGGTVTYNASAVRSVTEFGASSSFVIPIPLSSTAVFGTWLLYFNKASDNTRTIEATLYKYDMSTDTATQIGTPQNSSANSPGSITLGGVGAANTANCSFYIRVTASAGGVAVDRYRGAEIDE